MKSKPVQIAIIVIGLLVGVIGVVLAMSGDSGPNLVNKVILVDVSNGDTFTVSAKGRTILLPYENPETNERTLYPITKNEDDESWYLRRRHLPAIENVETKSGLVDKETGRVSIDSDIKPKSID